MQATLPTQDAVSAHDAFVAPARNRPALWRILVGLVITTVCYLAAIILMLTIVWALAGADEMILWMTPAALSTKPTALITFLATFAGMAVGAMLAAKWLHKRTAASLFGRGVMQGFALGAGVVGVLLLGSFFFIDPGYTLIPNLERGIWLSFLPLALAAIAVQTGAEELVFRGYLQQQLAARFHSPLVWMLVPSVAFGLLHFDPSGASGNAVLIIAATTLFGLAAADLTRVTGSIGVAWGFHFANNAYVFLLVSVAGGTEGLALFKTPFTSADADILQPLILQHMAVTLGLWLLLRGILHVLQSRG